MSWEQTHARQGVSNFFLQEFGVSMVTLIREALDRHLEKAGLSYKVHTDPARWEGDMYTEFHPEIIEISDGRVLVEVITTRMVGDSWGNDYYTFVEQGQPYEVITELHDGGEKDPNTTKDTRLAPSYVRTEDGTYVQVVS